MIEDNINKIGYDKFNVTCDLGHLMVYDNQPFSKDFVGEEDMLKRGKSNLKYFFEELFKLSSTQKGAEEDNRDFDKSEDNVKLPKPTTVLPRAKAIPKPKALTKWEKYRVEKGIVPKEKRSRMVYSETAEDWVPRWGKGSAKKIEEGAEWAIEEKPEMEGKDPFTLRSQEKKLGQMKQKKREMKNSENDKKTKSKGNNLKDIKEAPTKNFKKTPKNEKLKSKLKNDKKGLDKTLEIVQKSTASMGKFDKKLKNEKEINPIKQKKVDPTMMLSRKQERDRNTRILGSILGKNK